jgi:hypothetical protein
MAGKPLLHIHGAAHIMFTIVEFKDINVKPLEAKVQQFV